MIEKYCCVCLTSISKGESVDTEHPIHRSCIEQVTKLKNENELIKTELSGLRDTYGLLCKRFENLTGVVGAREATVVEKNELAGKASNQVELNSQLARLTKRNRENMKLLKKRKEKIKELEKQLKESKGTFSFLFWHLVCFFGLHF
jgi:hypothetical protein